MKIFRASCIDKITGLEIVASGCTYNTACRHLNIIGVNIIRTITDSNLVHIITKDGTPNFYIDEFRGLILKD